MFKFIVYFVFGKIAVFKNLSLNTNSGDSYSSWTLTLADITATYTGVQQPNTFEFLDQYNIFWILRRTTAQETVFSQYFYKLIVWFELKQKEERDGGYFFFFKSRWKKWVEEEDEKWDMNHWGEADMWKLLKSGIPCLWQRTRSD